MAEKKKSGLCCTFCGKSQDQVERLISGPGVYICDSCVDSLSAEARALEGKSFVAAGSGNKCSFCGQSPNSSRRCSCKKGTICFPCLNLCQEILEEEFDQVPRPRLTEGLVTGSSEEFLRRSSKAYYAGQDSRLKCSFCGKCQDQVKKIIAGPGVHICSECVILCQDILEAEEVSTSEPLSESVQDFDGTVATGDVSTLKKGDFVVCRVMEEQVGSYKVMVLTGGPEASFVSSERLSPGNMVIALYVRSEGDKIVLVGHQPF